MNAIMNKTNNGKRLMAAVAVLALIACAFMAVGVASELSLIHISEPTRP